MNRLAIILVTTAFATLGAALAQAVDNHTVTVKVPTLLRLSVDATAVTFDFGLGAETDPVTQIATLDQASFASYSDFLQNAVAITRFSPSTLTGAINDYVEAEILTNRAAWTLTVATAGTFPAPFDNDRLDLMVERDDVNGAKKGATTLGAWTDFGTGHTVAQAASGGQGKSFYKLYYGFQLDPADEITADYDETITLEYTLTAP